MKTVPTETVRSPTNEHVWPFIFVRHPPDPYEGFYLLTIAALHQENYATIPNYLERELRYMDAGE
jgi:hypothetical protein